MTPVLSSRFQAPLLRSLSGILAVLLIPALSTAAEPDAAAIDTLVADGMKAWDVPGVAVVIVRDGKVVYLGGHGKKRDGDDGGVTPDTLFPLGSCTKAFTTTALAMLVDEGKLGWDDPVHKHVPFFHLSDPLADQEVRIRDLLCHRTGVGSHELLWYRAAWSPEEAVRRIGFLPLDRPFRSGYQYQTSMFTTAGFAVASASGKPWDEFIRTRLFVPLGMKTAGTSTKSFASENRAAGHVPGPRGNLVPLAEWYPLPLPEPAGSIHASARDLGPWLQFQLDRGAIGGKRLVSESSLTQTHRAHTVIPMDETARQMHPETNQMSYALGWVVQDYQGVQLVSHTGVIDGFRAHITLVPRARLGIAILANRHQARLNLALSYSLVDLFLKRAPRDWNKQIAQALEKEQKAGAEKWKDRLSRRHQGTNPTRGASAYEGTYHHGAYGDAKISIEEGRLVLRISSFILPLEHFHYDSFVTFQEALGPIMLTFHLDAEGAVKELAVADPMNVVFRRK